MPYKLTVRAPETAYVGEPVTFTGELTFDGEGVGGVKIFLLINDEVVDETETLSNGNYEFQRVFHQPGTYKVQTSTTPKPPSKIPWSIIGAIMAGTIVVGVLSKKGVKK